VTLKVADIRANLNENIRHAARIIGKSKARRAVFAAIYGGKRQVKTVDDIRRLTGLSQVRVLQEAGVLAANGVVDKVKENKRTAYKKDEAFSHHKKRILDIVDNPTKKNRYPTKQEPKVTGATIRIAFPKANYRPVEVTVDDIEAFRAVRQIAPTGGKSGLATVPEARVKTFLRKVIGESRDFQDWGGEKNDLFTNKLRFRGRRRAGAFALKGRATKGVLTPKKMGKNGDQIARLFSSEAEVFLVVYHSIVDQAIHEQLRAFAVARALGGRHVFYGVLDGQDLGRLVAAYPKEFSAAK
jgi:hypothetical protein